VPERDCLPLEPGQHCLGLFQATKHHEHLDHVRQYGNKPRLAHAERFQSVGQRAEQLVRAAGPRPAAIAASLQDEVDVVDVDAAGGDVGRDERLDVAAPEPHDS
jgi:hypothetical protein